jgi:hypothetical protein
VLPHPGVQSWQLSQRKKRFQPILRFTRGPALFVGPANNAKVAEVALPPVWGGGKKRTSERVSNRPSNLNGRGARALVERNRVFDEAAK